MARVNLEEIADTVLGVARDNARATEGVPRGSDGWLFHRAVYDSIKSITQSIQSRNEFADYGLAKPLTAAQAEQVGKIAMSDQGIDLKDPKIRAFMTSKTDVEPGQDKEPQIKETPITNPRLRPRHIAKGLISPSRDATSLTEDQSLGAHAAGYEEARRLQNEYRWSHPEHDFRDEALLNVLGRDRRVPRNLTESDPDFWEWVEAILAGVDDATERAFVEPYRGVSEALYEGGKQATKPGKHGTLRLWRIAYTDSNDPGFGEHSYQRWAYDKQDAWDNFNEEVNSAGESWEIVKIESVLDTGPKRLSREARSEARRRSPRAHEVARGPAHVKRIALKSERRKDRLGGSMRTVWVIYDVDTGDTISASTDEQAERERFQHYTSGEVFDGGVTYEDASGDSRMRGGDAGEARRRSARRPSERAPSARRRARPQ